MEDKCHDLIDWPCTFNSTGALPISPSVVNTMHCIMELLYISGVRMYITTELCPPSYDWVVMRSDAVDGNCQSSKPFIRQNGIPLSTVQVKWTVAFGVEFTDTGVWMNKPEINNNMLSAMIISALSCITTQNASQDAKTVVSSPYKALFHLCQEFGASYNSEVRHITRQVLPTLLLQPF